jgi:hypothetical protein
MYYIKDLFPFLFHNGVVSVSYTFNGERYLVDKKDECVIVNGRYPLEFINDRAERLGWMIDNRWMESDWETYIEIVTNADGSVSLTNWHSLLNE